MREGFANDADMEQRTQTQRYYISFSRTLKRLVTDYFKSERLLQFIMRTLKELWLERSTLS